MLSRILRFYFERLIRIEFGVYNQSDVDDLRKIIHPEWIPNVEFNTSVRLILDYISGMTDNFAHHVSQEIKNREDNSLVASVA